MSNATQLFTPRTEIILAVFGILNDAIQKTIPIEKALEHKCFNNRLDSLEGPGDIVETALISLEQALIFRGSSEGNRAFHPNRQKRGRNFQS